MYYSVATSYFVVYLIFRHLQCKTYISMSNNNDIEKIMHDITRRI